MRRPQPLLATLLVVAACAHAPAAAPGPAPADPMLARLDTLRERLHIPGLAVAIVHRGHVRTYVRGDADLAWSIPVTARTSFQIASTTKVLTGTLLAQLVNEGRLRLSDPVARYLPDAPAAWSTMTLADLAAHASGLAEVDVPEAATVADVYAAARSAPLAYAPGTDVRYVATDLSVLQHVIERVTGTGFEALLGARVLDPAGMTCTRFEDAAGEGPTRTAEVIPRRATVYRWTGERQRTAWFLYPPHSYASGGVFSCLDDLAAWAVALDRGTLLAPALDRVAPAPYRRRDGTAAGFGAVFAVGTLHGRPWYGHSGGPALGDIVRIPDEQLTVIVLTNQQRLYPNLAAVIASELLGPAPPAASITDAEPARTAAHRTLLDGLSTGAVDAAAFAPEVRDELVAALRAWGPRQTAALPPLTGLALVADERRGTGRMRAYQAAYGTAVRVRWELALDATGAVTSLEGRVE